VRKSNFKNFTFIIIITAYFAVTQLPSLVYEIINWDLGTFLNVSNELARGNLIYEYQAEGKGPLIFYIYNFIIKISSGNIVSIKLFHDSLTLAAALLLYAINIKKFNSSLNSLFGSLGFLSFMSVFPYGHSENWEIFCINFVLIAVLLREHSLSDNIRKRSIYYFFIGMCISLSSLINIATLIFFLPFLVDIFNLTIENRQKIKYSLHSFFGFLLPWIYFILLYAFNNLLVVFFRYNFIFLINYREPNEEFLGKTIDNLKLYFIENIKIGENQVFYIHLFTLLLIGYIFIKYLITSFSTKNSFYFLIVFSGGLIYVLAQRGYFHHLFFLICFSSLYFGFVNTNIEKNILILIFVLNFSIFSFYNFEKIEEVATNFNQLQDNYPLLQFVKAEELSLDSEDTILALDHPMILFYLDKPNLKYYSHIIVKDYIKDQRNQSLEELLESKPDIIICSKSYLENCRLAGYYEYSFISGQESNTFFYNYDIYFFKKSHSS
jgi:hypothetical protein